MELAERSMNKNRDTRSQSKSHRKEISELRNRKVELIHQIEEKLAMPQNVEHYCQITENNDGGLRNRVLRLEKMMN